MFALICKFIWKVMHKKRRAFAPSGHMLFGSYSAMQQTCGLKSFYFCQRQTILVFFSYLENLSCSHLEYTIVS